MLKKLREEEGDDVAQRSALAELILPKVLIVGDDGLTKDVNHDAAKEWAFACGHIIGLLAGFSLQEDVLDGAIDEICRAAKRQAKDSHRRLLSSGLITAEPSHQGQLAAMIEDLEKQAAIETDLASAAALRSMAASMRRAPAKKEVA